MRGHVQAVLAVMMLGGTGSLLAQDEIAPATAATAGDLAPGDTAPGAEALSISGDWPADRWLAADEPVRLHLSRPLAADEGRLAVFVGKTDITSLTRVSGGAVAYVPTGLRLPSGELEVAVYLVTPGHEWRELARLPVRILTRRGFKQAALTPTLDLVSDGQLGRGGSAADAETGRRSYQDLTTHVGFQTALARPGWTARSQANAVGVSHDEQRLRFGELGARAPSVDLSDYLVSVESGRVSASLGHVSFGTNRHLISGFGSRGMTGAVRLGPAVSLGLAALGGSSMVGWSNALGLGRPGHRMLSASLDLEMVPARPGAAHLTVSALDGSVLPIAGYTQGVVNDAEKSRGVGFEIAASDVRQRIRLAAGLTRSRFVSPADALLDQGVSGVRVRPTVRSARFVDATVQIVQNWRLAGSVLANLSGTFRHERVDPLFRSAAAAPRADYERNVAGATATIGALALQYARTRGRDNLGTITSILTTRSADDALSATLPLGSLVRARPEAWWWPGVTVAYQVNRQHGDGVPDNGGFSASHVPDQLSRNRTLGLAWQRVTWNLSYRFNRSDQDNRQPDRERADFRALVHGLTLAVTPVTSLSLSLDLAHERQRAFELDQLQRTRRIGGQAEWRVFRYTALQGFVAQTWADDDPRTQQSRNLELRAEVSQGLNLYTHPASGTQARAFVRYARNAAVVEAPALGFTPDRILWSVAAGLSMRLY